MQQKKNAENFLNFQPTGTYRNFAKNFIKTLTDLIVVLGVLAAYRNCIRQIQLHGPTNFAPVINHVAKFATAFPDGSNYFILLILTDGIITDMPQTIQVPALPKNQSA